MQWICQHKSEFSAQRFDTCCSFLTEGRIIMSYDPKFKWSCDSSGLGRDNLGPSHSNIVLREKFFSVKEWTNIRSCSSRAFSVV